MYLVNHSDTLWERNIKAKKTSQDKNYIDIKDGLFSCFKIYSPDCLIVLDPRQKDLPQIYQGIKDKSTLIINLTNVPPKPLHPKIAKAGVVDATKIALVEIGIPAFNTCILGAFAATTGWIGLDAILTALENSFSGKLLERNIKSAERGYKEVTIVNW